MKKKHIIIMITSIITSIILIIASLGIYFVVLREQVDPFACVDISTTGLSGSGTASVLKNSTSTECKKLNRMEYTLDKRENLSNGDEVTMSVNPNSFLWFKHRIKPVTTSKIYKISNLRELPGNWDTLSEAEKNTITAKFDEKLNIFKKVIQSEIESNTQKSLGTSVDLRVDSDIISIWYRQSVDNTCKPSPEFHCDSVAYIYKLTPTANDSRYYYTGEEIYVTFIVTGVYYDENHEIVADVYQPRDFSGISTDHEVIAAELQGLDFKAV